MITTKRERKQALSSLNVGLHFLAENLVNNKEGKFKEVAFALVDINPKDMIIKVKKSATREFYRSYQKAEHFGCLHNIIFNTLLKAEKTLQKKIVCTQYHCRPGLDPKFTEGYLRAITQACHRSSTYGF